MSEALPRLHLISDRKLLPLDQFVDMVPALISVGVDAVHLREKDLPSKDLLSWARQLRSRIAKSARLIVNDRIDVALLSGADGVQLGEESVGIAEARSLVGSGSILGRSVHDAEGARSASEQGADFLILGNIFDTRSKPDVAGRGVSLVGQVARTADAPVIAIGGISPERVVSVMERGAFGVAVISGILAATDPIVAARSYHDQIQRSLETS